MTSPQHLLAACSCGLCCGCCSWPARSPSTHLLLQLHADGIGFLEEDGIAPEQVTEGGELVPLPLPKGPEGELEFPLCPLHCGDMEGQSLHHQDIDPQLTLNAPTQSIKTSWWLLALTFILRFFLLLICLRVISRIHLLLQCLQFALIVLGETGREVMRPTGVTLLHAATSHSSSLQEHSLLPPLDQCSCDNSSNSTFALIFRTQIHPTQTSARISVMPGQPRKEPCPSHLPASAAPEGNLPLPVPSGTGPPVPGA